MYLQVLLAVGILWELSPDFWFWYFLVTFQRHYQKHLTLAYSPGVIGSWLWTHGWDWGDPWELWEFCDCNRKRWGLRNCLSIWLLCQGTPVDTVGSKEVQTSDGDTLCSQHLPQALFVHWFRNNRRQGALLDRIPEVPSWPLCSQCLMCPLPGREWDQGSSGPFPGSVHANLRVIHHIPIYDLV